MNELVYAALSGTGHKIFKMKADENIETPYVIYTLINDKFDNCSMGMTDLKESLYQIDAYSKQSKEVDAIMESVITALNNATSFSAVMYSVTNSIENDGEVYRSRIEFNAWL